MLCKFFKNNRKELIFLLVFLFLVFIIKIFDVNCLIKHLFKTECPTCGMTRALISFIKLDLNSYLQYNAMALPVLIIFILQIFSKYFDRRKLNVVSIIVLLINIFYWILKKF